MRILINSVTLKSLRSFNSCEFHHVEVHVVCWHPVFSLRVTSLVIANAIVAVNIERKTYCQQSIHHVVVQKLKGMQPSENNREKLCRRNL